MDVVAGKSLPIREKRLHTISAYLGSAPALLQELQQGETKQRIRTFSQAAADDVISVLHLLSGIEDVAVVIHGPRGCSASQLYFDSLQDYKKFWSVTNLNERDTIMGGDESLRQAICQIYHRHHPRAIFVVTTPVVAINNDDVFSVVQELREELGALIIPIYADGFKSKTSVTGYDTALHALLKYLPLETKAEGKKADFINLLSITESNEDLKEIKRLTAALGLEANILPRTQALENFAKAAQAKVSIGINPDYSDYLGQVLAERCQVPFLQPQPPIGIQGTKAWLIALAKAVGLESQANNLHEQEAGRLAGQIAKYPLNQVKVYVNLPTALTWGIIGLMEELGAQVVGVTVQHLDLLHQPILAEFIALHPNLPLHVAQGQPFEQANLLQRLQPDLYIGSAATAVWAAKSGFPVVSVDHLPLLGYQGVETLARQLNKALSNPSFVRKISEIKTSYRPQWYAKSPNWHIKVEVK